MSSTDTMKAIDTIKYEYIDDLTSDVAFKAYGKTPQEVFSNAAEALIGIMCDIKQVQCSTVSQKHISLTASGDSLEDLLFNWLQELIAAVEIEGVFFVSFDIHEITNTSLRATITGVPVTEAAESVHVKAITNYLFKLEKVSEGFIATVSVDV